MRRMSFSEELRSLGERGGGVDACECWGEVLRLHRSSAGRARLAARVGRSLGGPSTGAACCATPQRRHSARRVPRRGTTPSGYVKPAAGTRASRAARPADAAAADAESPAKRAAAKGGGWSTGRIRPAGGRRDRWATERPDGQGRRKGRGRGGRGRNRRGARTGATA